MTTSPVSVSLIDLARDPAWEDVLAHSSPSQFEARLGEADVLADGSDADRAVALSTYRVLQRALLPTTSRDCDRVEWVLNTLRAYDMRFAPLLERASRRAVRTQVRQRAAVALGAFHVHANDYARGERLFLRVLADARGRGTIPERAACLNLCRLYSLQWRVFEGYSLARHAVRLFREARDPIREAWSLVEVFRCLTEMREWESCDALVPEIESLFESLSPDTVAETATEFLHTRLRCAVERGDVVEARRLVGGLPEHPPAGAPTARYPWFNSAITGVVQSLRGLHEEAAETLAIAREEIPRDVPSWLVMLQHEATCAARRGDDERLVTNARELLSFAGEAIIRRMGSGRAMHILLLLAGALRDRGHESLKRRALDGAAACAIQRIHEIERVRRDIPELAFVTPDDHALLTRVRKRFRDRHRELLDALVREFERAEAAGEPWLESLLSGDHAVVCAWCTRLRSDDGEWMPVGHLLPHAGPLPLTHGICQTCIEEIQAGR